MEKGNCFEAEFKVDEKVYKGFIDVFCDRNPLHTDAAFAKTKGFDAEVMFGNILNGFISYFIGECLPVKNVIIHAQDIKFMKPVYLNDSLRLSAEVSDVYESVNTVVLKYFFQNQHQVKIARGSVQIGII